MKSGQAANRSQWYDGGGDREKYLRHSRASPSHIHIQQHSLIQIQCIDKYYCIASRRRTGSHITHKRNSKSWLYKQHIPGTDTQICWKCWSALSALLSSSSSLPSSPSSASTWNRKGKQTKYSVSVFCRRKKTYSWCCMKNGQKAVQGVSYGSPLKECIQMVVFIFYILFYMYYMYKLRIFWMGICMCSPAHI